ncbi:MAG: bifunctional protein conserved domain protein [Mycobacterium sp.]|nr:bifunctional protein conserved domain protein [Mycobacterium sp.]
MPVSEQVMITGHLLDTGVLADVLDDVYDYGGWYVVDAVHAGRTHDDESHALLTVSAESEAALVPLLMRIQRHGVNTVQPGELVVREADCDGAFPADFYATTNLETVVHLDGGWVPVERPESGCALLVSGERVRTVPVEAVRTGMRIVCGVGGVRVVPPLAAHRPSEAGLGALSSTASGEHSQPDLVRQVAQRLRECKTDGHRVLWVLGPAVVSADAGPALARLVRAGFVDGVVAGNAVAAADIEAAVSGVRTTSLALSATDPAPERRVRAVNAVRRAGGLTEAVREGIVAAGLMHTVVEAAVPLVLVGSVRDKSALPDTHTDLLAALEAMRAAVRGVGLAIVVASADTAGAVVGLLPESVPVVAVDLDARVTADLLGRPRPSRLQVTADAGLFCATLAQLLLGPEPDPSA